MTTPSIGIVGTGFAGLGIAIELKRAGLRDITLLDKADELGGVWRENTYPGAGCDIPSPLYSFSYEPHTTWPKRFSLRSDIHDYMKNTARKYGIDAHIRFGTEVTAAEFDAAANRWRVSTAAGKTLEFDVLVSAVGQLSRPSMPDIPGMADFRGRSFHSAHWDQDHDLTGERVAVIGTGASAIQFVPQIQPVVGRLTIFQRTAPYLLPKPDRQYSRWHHKLFRRFPLTQSAGRVSVWALCETITKGLIGNHSIAHLVQWISLGFLRLQVRDRELRKTLTPDYPAGCKRILFANDYYPALAQPNVRVETAEITGITPDGVRTADGVEHKVDTIIYGTGFATADFLAPMTVRGLDGKDLHTDAWAGGARAYLGMAVPGFPNLFLMYGPNTNLGAGSIIYMLERQARYITKLVRQLRSGTALNVRTEVADRFDAEMQRRLAGTVWATCASWYRTESGRVVTNWPGLVSEYDRRTRTADLAAYDIVDACRRLKP
ncbi:cation diffusion facilitator CzcD-associated flavoprotein CzcO [Kibdelosporangium banguiense]|uniref:Cation diffusion facilitator CzcD-associated flavoprotein CzcO n=1 Tax=Kibdelosporangium banguiense TaxID=1365924 RepID=A0ABS4TQQ0_9PSEU|nr:NAD(P)/FAD-dependent oxidoreductase [Kibdelosporangium banguiense]MBP2326270.1 cation diffusion facilitator CzcD-associated flavoprotein CzcO [Kibdelosporangium banguiense]